MARPRPAPVVKLICGMISARPALLDESRQALEAAFGPVDLASPDMPFDFTHYYDDEMGQPLLRRFVAFGRLVEADFLVEAKLRANAIEAQFAARMAVPARPVNLDPGYIAPSKLVLASMKDFSHRLYLGRGVFGEVTLMYHGGAWTPQAWTFPDYASPRYHRFLLAVRDSLRRAEKENRQ